MICVPSAAPFKVAENCRLWESVQDFRPSLIAGPLRSCVHDTRLAMLQSKWAGCTPVARHHSGPHVSTITRVRSKHLRGLSRRFRPLTCLGAWTALYKAAVSALY